MHPNLLADRSEYAVGQLHRIVSRIQFTSLLPLPNYSEHPLKIPTPLRWIDRIRWNFFRCGEDRGKNQPGQILMPIGKIEQCPGHLDESLLAARFPIEFRLHQ